MQFIKKILPSPVLKFIRPFGHGFIAMFASVWFGRPSDKLIVIGVTGTNGKSTTVNLIAKILEESGFKVGFTSTVNYQIGDWQRMNHLKMTMPSGWIMHKWLKQMVEAKCQYAVLEISSEGLSQNRHLGINFDIAVFTNLTPEHIESHGGFENYKRAKAKLFMGLHRLPITTNKTKINSNLRKTIITNIDDQYGDYFGNFPAEKYLTYGINNIKSAVDGTEVVYTPGGVSFSVDETRFNLQLKGKFDVYNSLAAIAVSKSQFIELPIAKKALEKIPVIPGRMEIIQEQPFTVLIDYAPEPYSLKALYDTLSHWPRHKLIHILGSTGGGRDKSRRKILGEMAGKTADIVIVTNEDPYDDDPKEIIHQVADGATASGKIIGTNLFRNPDRRGAIAKAFSLAEPGDIVLITGKGSEQKMAVANGKYIDWDDREVVREELGRMMS